MRRFAMVAVLALVALAASARAAAAAAGESPYDQVVRLAQVGEPVPAAAFIDQDGHAVAVADLRGRAAAFAFVYTRCKDACPLITAKFAQAAVQLGDGPYRLVEVTIDPAYDSASVIRAYARKHGMRAPGWRIVTGGAAAIGAFERRLGVQAIVTSPSQFIHADRLVLAAPDGTISAFVDGPSWTPADLEAQLRHLAGQPASVLDRIDLALGAAAAYCGGLVVGRGGIADLIASVLVVTGGVWLFVWLARRFSNARA